MSHDFGVFKQQQYSVLSYCITLQFCPRVKLALRSYVSKSTPGLNAGNVVSRLTHDFRLFNPLGKYSTPQTPSKGLRRLELLYHKCIPIIEYLVVFTQPLKFHDLFALFENFSRRTVQVTCYLLHKFFLYKNPLFT